MDTKTCVTALAIAASSRSCESLAVSSAAINQFVRAISGGALAQLEALRDLRQSYAALRLDGETASAVQTLIEDKMIGLHGHVAQPQDADGSAAVSVQI